MRVTKQPEAPDSKPKPRVLFVCIGNSCRSPMAESIARRDSSHVFDSTSAGLTPLGVVQKQTIETLADNGYPVEDLSSNAIRNDEWTAADLVVNMSGYPKQRVFPRTEWHKVEDWNVEDPYGSDPIVYQKIFDDIRTRIESLTARFRDGHQQSRP
jgi:protein-tyrosine-phosphatase